MSFGDSIKTCFSKIIDFNGRARRSEYWYFRVFVVVISIIISAILGQENQIASIFSLLLSIASWSVEVRRLHDIGRSGWWVLLDLVPVVGWIILLVWLIRDSDPGENQYGPNPKGL